MTINEERHLALFDPELAQTSYTKEDHETWAKLFCRQVAFLKNRVCPEFMEGLDRLGLGDGRVPNFRHLNEKLKVTGWSVIPATGALEEERFFEFLSRRNFPAICSLILIASSWPSRWRI